MTRRSLVTLGLVVAEAAVLVVAARLVGVVPTSLGWVALVGWRAWRLADRQANRGRLAIEAMVGLSLIILVVLNRLWGTEIGLGLIYLIWRLAAGQADQLRLRLWRLGFAAFITLTAIFTATAIWRWPVFVVLGLVWLSSWVVARELLAPGERAGEILAAAWALVATEISYLFAVWLVSYILPGNILVVPQAAIVLAALGYCFMNIYIAHINAKLSRSRLAEYAIIGVCLLIIVMAGTKWNGAI